MVIIYLLKKEHLAGSKLFELYEHFDAVFIKNNKSQKKRKVSANVSTFLSMTLKENLTLLKMHIFGWLQGVSNYKIFLQMAPIQNEK